MEVKTVKKIFLLIVSFFLFLALGYSLYSQDILLNTILVNIMRVSLLVYLTVLFTSRLFLFKEKTFLTLVELVLLIGFQFLIPLNVIFQFVYLTLFTVFAYNLIDDTKDVLFSESSNKGEGIDYRSRVKPKQKDLTKEDFVETLNTRFEKKLKEAQERFETAYVVKNHIIKDKGLMKSKGKVIKINYLLLTEKGVYIFETINNIKGDLYALDNIEKGKWLEGRPEENSIKQIPNPVRKLEGKKKRLMENIENSEYAKKHSTINENKIYKNIVFNNETNFCLNRQLENINIIKEEELDRLIDNILSSDHVLKEKELLGLYYELI